MTTTPQKSFCLFCRTGQEQAIADRINEEYTQLQAIAPTKVLPEKLKGQWRNRPKTLLPGYIFLYTDDEVPHDLRHKTNHTYRLLEYERGVRTLIGPDADYAMWLLRHQGQIQPSRILAIGEHVKVIDGPLMDFQGRIKKMDRHKRRIWVEFDFDSQKRTISIGAEYLSDPKQADPFQRQITSTIPQM